MNVMIKIKFNFKNRLNSIFDIVEDGINGKEI